MPWRPVFMSTHGVTAAFAPPGRRSLLRVLDRVTHKTPCGQGYHRVAESLVRKQEGWENDACELLSLRRRSCVRRGCWSG
jgi:hypothetical protein